MVNYEGGSTGFSRWMHTIPAGACTVVTSGTALRCPSMPGVGANYTFAVSVDGVASAPSAVMLSYAPPIINRVDGAGALNGDALGGQPVLLHGIQFGTVLSGAVIEAWATPVTDPSLVFPGQACAVVEDDSTILCTSTPSVGAKLTWHLVVEGQRNALPVASVGLPVVSIVLCCVWYTACSAPQKRFTLECASAVVRGFRGAPFPV